MHGNVWEWVQDDWSDKYAREAQTDPIYAQGGSRRVCRGGSWHGGARVLRAACRNGGGPGNRRDGLGFRPARTF